MKNMEGPHRHAFLCMVHANLPVVKAALRMIDDERNDVFIYINSEALRQADFRCAKSRVYFLHQKISYTWANLMQPEIALLKFATSIGHYDYYHLMSDACLPIKTQDEIHAFFDNDDKKQIYMHVNCHWFPSIQREAATKYPFFHRDDFKKRKDLKLLAKILVRVKMALGVKRSRNNKEIPIVDHGWNWGSLPHDFVAYIIEKEELLHRTFDYALANEETAFQSLAMNSHFRERMYGFNGRDDAQDASKRMIGWNPKHWTPLVFTEKDYDAIMANKNCFFARKFYADVDMEIVRKIELALTGKSPIQSSQDE